MSPALCIHASVSSPEARTARRFPCFWFILGSRECAAGPRGLLRDEFWATSGRACEPIEGQDKRSGFDTSDVTAAIPALSGKPASSGGNVQVFPLPRCRFPSFNYVLLALNPPKQKWPQLFQFNVPPCERHGYRSVFIFVSFSCAPLHLESNIHRLWLGLNNIIQHIQKTNRDRFLQN